jgi:hypothetical protein
MPRGLRAPAQAKFRREFFQLGDEFAGQLAQAKTKSHISKQIEQKKT